MASAANVQMMFVGEGSSVRGQASLVAPCHLRERSYRTVVAQCAEEKRHGGSAEVVNLYIPEGWVEE